MKKLYKQLFSILLCLPLLLTSFSITYAKENSYSNEKNFYLDDIKQEYIDNYCFYQVTDTDYLNSLTDNDIIEVYQNIKVTKKLLNEDMILDIDKVTASDIVSDPQMSTYSSPISPQVFDTETRCTLSSSYDNVVVLKEAVAASGPYAGTSVYIANIYLSNTGIKDFGYYSWVYEYKFGSSLKDTVNNMIAGTAVCFIPSKTFGVVFTIVTGAASLGNIIMTNNFRTNLNNLYEAGNKAVVTITSTSQSCSKWSDRYFYIENASRNGLNITSTYRPYADK